MSKDLTPLQSIVIGSMMLAGIYLFVTRNDDPPSPPSKPLLQADGRPVTWEQLDSFTRQNRQLWRACKEMGGLDIQCRAASRELERRVLNLPD